MAKHAVKSWCAFFQAIKRGDKLHDLRDARDRKFEVGDTLVLQEYDHVAGKYTGEEIERKITFITGRDTPCALSSAVLQPGYVILSLKSMGGTISL